MRGENIRVTGIVQGVGLRPTVWRLANECGIAGQVWNDTEGVVIHAWGSRESLDELVQRLETEQPPLSRIEQIVRTALDDAGEAPKKFQIVISRDGEVRTSVAADAATCAECLAEVLDPANRRYRYPFTNCTHCGPRLSIVSAIPYDRANTSMASFPMCPQCQAEYDNPADRRFHAQPNACSDCGPRVWLEDADGNRQTPVQDRDVIETAAQLIRQGNIVAIKGIGGFHLACDAGNENAVYSLRRRKHRYHKALALMACDIDMVARFAEVNEMEATLLHDRTAPIVVLNAAGESLATGVAPGQHTLGFMLPYTPLHHLLMQDMTQPMVLTSGNRSDEPQTIDNRDARQRLDRIADYYLLHDRDIFNRLDDSVLSIADSGPRFLRRARGYAPLPVALPEEFAASGHILAMGGELKNTFCLLKQGQAVLSQHVGDLEDAVTFKDYRRNLDLYRQLFDHRPMCIAVDKHPDYLSTRLGREQAQAEGLQLVEVQHHHAHIASCLFENGLSLKTDPVLGVALDGLGYGEDGTLWGGEFLLADYHDFKRLGTFKPVAMPGGEKAVYQPWRNTYAHLMSAMGWARYKKNYDELELTRFLESRPLDVLNTMLLNDVNSPLASSCGRLFDAVAAAMGICHENAHYESQAAIEMEACVDHKTLYEEDDASAYPFAIPVLPGQALPYIEPLAMWQALLGDLILKTPVGVMAARFHKGLAQAIVAMVSKLTKRNGQRFLNTVALSGGVFQNKILLEQVIASLEANHFKVLNHRQVPSSDGGLSLGQAAVAAARSIKNTNARG